MSRYHLEMFLEQGCEGAYWSVYDTTKEGYEGLITLEDGMKIRIPGKWEGTIKKDRDTNRQWFRRCKEYVDKEDYRAMLESFGYETVELSNSDCEELARSNHMQQVAGGYWCHWVQEGVDPDVWAEWFIKKLPVEFI